MSGCEDSSGIYTSSASIFPDGKASVSGSIAGVDSADRCAVEGTIEGWLRRLGTTDIANLLLTYVISCDRFGTQAEGVTSFAVEARFVPTFGNGVTTRVQEAVIAGTWQALEATQ